MEGQNLHCDLIIQRRKLELTARAARLLLSKAHSEGHMIFDLIKPALLPPLADSFPCTRDKLSDFLEEVAVGEGRCGYNPLRKCPFGSGPDRLGRRTHFELGANRPQWDWEAFMEFDCEGGCFGGYTISNRPLYDAKEAASPGKGYPCDSYPIRHYYSHY